MKVPERRGTRKDIDKAFQWYLKAAELRNAVAMYNLAVIYSNGSGVAQDNQKVSEWFHKAAELGEPHAKEALGKSGRPQ